MKLIVWIRTIWNVLKKLFGGSININRQKGCTNCPVFYGDNNTVGANIAVSEEKPNHQKEGDIWLHITGKEDT